MKHFSFLIVLLIGVSLLTTGYANSTADQVKQNTTKKYYASVFAGYGFILYDDLGLRFPALGVAGSVESGIRLHELMFQMVLDKYNKPLAWDVNYHSTKLKAGLPHFWYYGSGIGLSVSYLKHESGGPDWGLFNGSGILGYMINNGSKVRYRFQGEVIIYPFWHSVVGARFLVDVGG